MEHPPEVQLATLVSRPPAGEEWLHEQKFDGYRIVAQLDQGEVHLWSRRGHDWTAKFPRVAAAVARLPVERAVLDGEVCVLGDDGRTSFQALQNAIGTDDRALVYFVFDLLECGDEDFRPQPLEHRKARLRTLLPKDRPTIRYSDHVLGCGEAFFAAACERGLEGIVSKLRAKPYQPGRGTAWLKTKCVLRQELVVGGFTEGARDALGALLVGYYQAGKLVYAGKVGTGFTQKMLEELHRRLVQIEVKACPFSPAPPRASTGPNAHWVTPSLVAEVAFSEWTEGGRLRHPSFQGLRADKEARDITRDQPIC